jgi:hypothetical protein
MIKSKDEIKKGTILVLTLGNGDKVEYPVNRIDGNFVYSFKYNLESVMPISFYLNKHCFEVKKED